MPPDGPRHKDERAIAFVRGEAPQPTAVYNGGAIGAGQRVDGPAVIDLPTTGIVIPPGTSVVRSDVGDFIMTFGGNQR